VGNPFISERRWNQKQKEMCSFTSVVIGETTEEMVTGARQKEKRKQPVYLQSHTSIKKRQHQTQ
jgi:hypothetical protein